MAQTWSLITQQWRLGFLPIWLFCLPFIPSSTGGKQWTRSKSSIFCHNWCIWSSFAGTHTWQRCAEPAPLRITIQIPRQPPINECWSICMTTRLIKGMQNSRGGYAFTSREDGSASADWSCETRVFAIGPSKKKKKGGTLAKCTTVFTDILSFRFKWMESCLNLRSPRLVCCNRATELLDTFNKTSQPSQLEEQFAQHR